MNKIMCRTISTKCTMIIINFDFLGDAKRKDSAPPASDIGKLNCSFIIIILIWASYYNEVKERVYKITLYNTPHYSNNIS